MDLYEGEGTEESGPVGEGNEEKGGDSVPQLLTYGEEDGEGEDLIGVTGSGYNAWDGGKGEREKKLKEEERKARKARRKKRKEKKARREMKVCFTFFQFLFVCCCCLFWCVLVHLFLL